MRDLERTAADTGQALATFHAAISGLDGVAWTRPVAPGKWSPAQITEHVAITFELGAGLIEGKAEMPGVPWFMRAAIRVLFLPRILKSGAFPRGGKTSEVFQPGNGAPDPAAGLARLEAGVERFESSAGACLAAGRSEFLHPVFGKMTPADYQRLQEIHILHHLRQLPGVEQKR